MGAMNRLRRSAASSKWKNLRARKTRASTGSSENLLTVATLREDDRSGEIDIPEPIRENIEGLRGQTLRKHSKDFFKVIYIKLSLVVDLEDDLRLIISIVNSIKEHDEVSDINLTVEKINEFMKARDPFHPLLEMLPLFSKQRIKIRQSVQVLKEKMDSKAKRFKFWKKVTRVVSWSVFLVAFGVVLSLSIIDPTMAPIATICSNIVRPLEELMLSFCNKREAELKKMIKVVDAIEKASVPERPPVIGSIEKFASEGIDELKQLLYQWIQDRDAKSAMKGVEGFKKRVVEIKEEVEKWHDFTEQESMKVVSSLR